MARASAAAGTTRQRRRRRAAGGGRRRAGELGVLQDLPLPQDDGHEHNREQRQAVPCACFQRASGVREGPSRGALRGGPQGPGGAEAGAAEGRGERGAPKTTRSKTERGLCASSSHSPMERGAPPPRPPPPPRTRSCGGGVPASSAALERTQARALAGGCEGVQSGDGAARAAARRIKDGERRESAGQRRSLFQGGDARIGPRSLEGPRRAACPGRRVQKRLRGAPRRRQVGVWRAAGELLFFVSAGADAKRRDRGRKLRARASHARSSARTANHASIAS